MPARVHPREQEESEAGDARAERTERKPVGRLRRRLGAGLVAHTFEGRVCCGPAAQPPPPNQGGDGTNGDGKPGDGGQVHLLIESVLLPPGRLGRSQGPPHTEGRRQMRRRDVAQTKPGAARCSDHRYRVSRQPRRPTRRLARDKELGCVYNVVFLYRVRPVAHTKEEVSLFYTNQLLKVN